MKGFIEFITDPAWWSVIATFVAAYVAARITSKFSKRQNELQEQQLKIQERQNELQEQQIKQQEIQTKLMVQQAKVQEHDQYKELYLIIRAIHHKSNTIISTIAQTLYWFPTEDFCYDTFREQQGEISELIQKFSVHKIELYLKADIDDIQYCNYQMVLRRIIFMLDAIIGNLQFGEATTYGVEYKPADSDEKCIEYILQCADYSARKSIKKSFDDFISTKTKISEYKVLQSLEEHCKF